MFQYDVVKEIGPAQHGGQPTEVDISQEIVMAAQQQGHVLRPMDKFNESNKWEEVLASDGSVMGHHYDGGAQGLFAAKHFQGQTMYAVCNPMSLKLRLFVTVSQV